MSYEALFSPFKVRGLELKNRIVLPGMNTKMAKNKHDIGEDMIALSLIHIWLSSLFKLLEYPDCIWDSGL